MASYFYAGFVPTLLRALLVIQVLEFSHSKASTNCIGAEREAILNFKRRLTKPSRHLLSWTGDHCCKWEGVKSSEEIGHVSKLHLRNPCDGLEKCGLRDLSSNALDALISEGLTRLARLQNLNLSRKNLIGKIPSDIGDLRHLESLDLSKNKLLGEIPPSISNSDFLGRLEISFTDLLGLAPSGSHLSTLEDQSVFRGNDGLCGAPLVKVCPRDDHNKMDR
ncbi:receptor-like protein 35 [Rhodamnia argentea]|uniref:Receptor-like protein 35 n=1 Tax=Rhodamnia argentea TaxID=178133 RepID=A0A8B8P2S0_9MYRT|nr:receptor-like protein 35 [Rhodamnia argentea]